jgi:hypothetical protein
LAELEVADVSGAAVVAVCPLLQAAMNKMQVIINTLNKFTFFVFMLSPCRTRLMNDIVGPHSPLIS